MMNVFREGEFSEAEIVPWLIDLRKNCYVPESGFCATAVFRSGDYYFGGVNVENVDHRVTTHAEEACIAAMVAGLGKHAEISEGWVMGAPQGLETSDALASCCGKCRQQIAGFAEGHVKIHYVSLNGKVSATTVGEFLPDAFTFAQYLPETGAVEKTGRTASSCEAVENRLVRRAELSEKDIFCWLEEIDSVDYASKVSQSVVLKLDNGAYVAGSKIEDAAFLSINAAQSALAIAVSEFGKCAIEEVWCYTKGHNSTLTLSALQTLMPMAANSDMTIQYFADNGSMFT